MIEAGEQHFIEQFVTHLPVKTLDERILRWLFRGSIMPVNLGVPAPFERRIRGQLSAIIADDHAGLAVEDLADATIDNPAAWQAEYIGLPYTLGC